MDKKSILHSVGSLAFHGIYQPKFYIRFQHISSIIWSQRDTFVEPQAQCPRNILKLYLPINWPSMLYWCRGIDLDQSNQVDILDVAGLASSELGKYYS